MAYVYSGKNQYDIADLMRPREMQASTAGPKPKPHPLEKFGKLLNLYGNLAKAALPPADGEGRLPVDRDRLLRSIIQGAGAIVPMMAGTGAGWGANYMAPKFPPTSIPSGSWSANWPGTVQRAPTAGSGIGAGPLAGAAMVGAVAAPPLGDLAGWLSKKAWPPDVAMPSQKTADWLTSGRPGGPAMQPPTMPSRWGPAQVMPGPQDMMPSPAAPPPKPPMEEVPWRLGGQTPQTGGAAPYPMYPESRGWDTAPGWLQRGVDANRAASGGRSGTPEMPSPGRTKLSAQNERLFQDWYGRYSQQNNLDPNPDDPQHYYDYRGWWSAMRDEPGRWEPKRDLSDGRMHAPDRWKAPGHPTYTGPVATDNQPPPLVGSPLPQMTPEEQTVARNRALMMARNPQLARAIPGAGPQAPPPQLQMGMGEDPGMLAEIGSLAGNLDPMMGGGYRYLDPNRPRLPGGSAAMGASFERQQAMKMAQEATAQRMAEVAQEGRVRTAGKTYPLTSGEPRLATIHRYNRRRELAGALLEKATAAQAAGRYDEYEKAMREYATLAPGALAGEAAGAPENLERMKGQRVAAAGRARTRRETGQDRLEAARRGMTPEALKAERRMLERVGTGAEMTPEEMLMFYGSDAGAKLLEDRRAKEMLTARKTQGRQQALSDFLATLPAGTPLPLLQQATQNFLQQYDAAGLTPGAGPAPLPDFDPDIAVLDDLAKQHKDRASFLQAAIQAGIDEAKASDYAHDKPGLALGLTPKEIKESNKRFWEGMKGGGTWHGRPLLTF